MWIEKSLYCGSKDYNYRIECDKYFMKYQVPNQDEQHIHYNINK